MRSVLTLLALTLAAPAFGHGGATDSSGGHHDRKHGGYHYHGGGSTAATRRSYSNTGRLSSGIRQDYERRASLRQYSTPAELKAKHDQAIAEERRIARWKACQRVEAVEVIGTRGKDTLHDLFALLYPKNESRPLNDGDSVPAAAGDLHRSHQRSDLRDALSAIIQTYPSSHEAGEAFDSLVTLDHHVAEEHEREAKHQALLEATAAREEREKHELAHNEGMATARLHMAQRLIEVGHDASVNERLEKIIRVHGDTKAAVAAAELLAERQ